MDLNGTYDYAKEKRDTLTINMQSLQSRMEKCQNDVETYIKRVKEKDALLVAVKRELGRLLNSIKDIKTEQDNAINTIKELKNNISQASDEYAEFERERTLWGNFIRQYEALYPPFDLTQEKRTGNFGRKRVLTDEQRQLMIEERRAGKTIRCLAKKYGVSFSWVSKVCTRNGVYIGKPATYRKIIKIKRNHLQKLRK
ncbi:MAG: hypothetical protein LBP59_10615 [Planctomycetaceae bacterium]|jgi:chromosome segregation ATPase|nr:hypothetical protein [Planctomycetaceae bacterium]